MHFISSHRHFTISHHHKKGEYSTIRSFKRVRERERERERDNIHITFSTVYCYSCSILGIFRYLTDILILFLFLNIYILLLIIIVNLLLYLIYKLNFILGMHVQEKTQYIQGLVLSTVSGINWVPQNISAWIRGDYCMSLNFLQCQKVRKFPPKRKNNPQ